MLISRAARINRNSLEISIALGAHVSNPKVRIFFGRAIPEVLIQLEHGTHYSGRVMKCELERGDKEETTTRTRTTSAMPKTFHVGEAERYNHKPVIDLLVLKSQALEQRECLPVIEARH